MEGGGGGSCRLRAAGMGVGGNGDGGAGGALSPAGSRQQHRVGRAWEEGGGVIPGTPGLAGPGLIASPPTPPQICSGLGRRWRRRRLRGTPERWKLTSPRAAIRPRSAGSRASPSTETATSPTGKAPAAGGWGKGGGRGGTCGSCRCNVGCSGGNAPTLGLWAAWTPLPCFAE